MAKLNPKKLTVAKLKSELDARSIEYPSNIKKPQLIELLTAAMDSEGDVSMASNPADDSVVSQDESMSQESTSMAEDNEEPASEAVEGSGGGDANPKEPEATTADEDAAAQPEPQPEAADEPAEAMEASDELTEAAPAPAEEESADSSEKEVEGVMEQEVAEEKDDATPEKITENGDGETHDDAEKAQDGAEKAQDDADDKDEKKDSESKEDDKDKSAKIEGSKPKHRREETEKERMDRKRRYEERHRKNDERYAPPPDEPEEEFDDTLVVMDKYDSDLNIKFYKDRLTAQVLTLESFAYMWAGARATYGVTAAGNRKVCYECKVTDEHSVRHLPSGHKHRHVARVGWSCNDTSLVLGEQARSYCFCSTAKKVADRKADDFGEEFKKDDVVGCYLDFSDEENFKVSYTKNGKYLGEAFSEEKSKLEEKALFPHILCKNTTIEFNFGEKEEAFFPHPEELEGFEFIGKLSVEDRVRGAVGPATKKECDMLMMCGLPGAGKTQYANKQVEEQPDKRYHILGTNAIMAKMDVTGISQAKPMPRDEKLFHATNCLNRLFQIACRKKRNYIFDQTNVFSSARRKMRTYEGFTRKAVVIVPSDEEYKSRVSKRSKDDGAKDIPEGAVYEMKANFSFPEGDLFEEVIFVGLEKAEAEKVVAKYREEARKNGPPPEKRFRGGGYGGGGQRSGGRWSQDKGGRPGGFRQSPAAGRGGYQPPYGGGFRGGQRNGGRGGFGNDRRGGGGWNDKSGGGGWSSGQNRGYGGGRGGYGGNRSSPAGSRGGFNNKSGGGGRGSYGGGGNRNNSGGGYQGNQRNNRNGGAPNAGSQRGGNNRNAQQQPYNYHAAYQQQQAQLAQSAPVPPHQNDAAAYNQAYTQQQNDYSAQWAAYYQQQAQMAQQQQAAAAAAQYQNYYASYAQAYGAYPPPAP